MHISARFKKATFKGREYIAYWNKTHGAWDLFESEEDYIDGKECYAAISDGRVWRHNEVIGDAEEIETYGDEFTLKMSMLGIAENINWALSHDDPFIRSEGMMALLTILMGGRQDGDV